MDYAETLEFLYNLEHGSIKLGLERIEAAVAALGHPERSYQTIHVAGTNGKGSTTAFLASIFEAAGYRTGLLSSPHLLEYGERFRIGGRMVAPEEIIRFTEKLKPVILAEQLSYFEATTALAFVAFAENGVDVAVIEVGMGGRLDATNVITPALTVITGIEIDHTKSLGATRELIAGEKAGIIKPGAPVIVGPVTAGVRAVFAETSAQLDAPLHEVTRLSTLQDVEPEEMGSVYRFTRGDSNELHERFIRLRGWHQAQNALLAEEGARLLDGAGLSVPESACRQGLAQVGWPGRFDIRSVPGSQVRVIFDVAHNAGGGVTVARTYQRWCRDDRQPSLIVGMLGDKDYGAFLASLREISASIFLIPLDSSRAGDPAVIKKEALDLGFTVTLCGDIEEAWQKAQAPGAPVLITGSFKTVEAGMKALGFGPDFDLFAAGSESRSKT